MVEAGKGSLVHKNRKSHGLALFLGGERIFRFDDFKLKVDGNAVVYFPKGSNYTIQEKTKSDCYAVNFQLSNTCKFEPFVFKTKKKNQFLQHFQASQKYWMTQKPGYNAKIKSILYSIIYNMQAEFSLPYGKISVIQPAVEYIHENYDKKTITVSYLANICNISTVHLSNCFVKAFAMPPIKYINDLRMHRAKELLKSQLYTVSDVCFLSGYRDESYFSREFKKCFDMTPGEYKRQW